MTPLLILTATAALLSILVLTSIAGGHLRLREAVADGFRFILSAREPGELDRHDRSELTARLWVP